MVLEKENHYVSKWKQKVWNFQKSQSQCNKERGKPLRLLIRYLLIRYFNSRIRAAERVHYLVTAAAFAAKDAETAQLSRKRGYDQLRYLFLKWIAITLTPRISNCSPGPFIFSASINSKLLERNSWSCSSAWAIKQAVHFPRGLWHQANSLSLAEVCLVIHVS